MWLGLSLIGRRLGTEFSVDGAAAPAQQSGDLADGLFGFQEAVNFVSFFSAEVLVHLATWTWRFE
jgi:hypothetical protein